MFTENPLQFASHGDQQDAATRQYDAYGRLASVVYLLKVYEEMFLTNLPLFPQVASTKTPFAFERNGW